MANDQNLPGFDRKRSIMFSDRSSDEKLRETGRLYMEDGRYYDALDFFERAEAEDLTRQVAELALEQGDTPLYMRAKKVLEEQITDEEWQTLARNAEERQNYSAARIAQLKAGNEDEARRLAALMPGAEAREEGEGEDRAEQEETQAD